MSENEGNLRTVQSAGGPLLALDSALLGYWTGIDTLVTADIAVTDYERASNVQGDTDLIPVGPGYGIVLWDEPLPTAWWHSPSIGSGMFVRFKRTRDIRRVTTGLRHLQGIVWRPTGLILRLRTNHLILFDSTFSGESIRSEFSIISTPYAGLSMGSYLDIQTDDDLNCRREYRPLYARWNLTSQVNSTKDIDAIVIEIPRAAYSLETADYQLDEDTWLLLHRLVPASGVLT